MPVGVGWRAPVLVRSSALVCLGQRGECHAVGATSITRWCTRLGPCRRLFGDQKVGLCYDLGTPVSTGKVQWDEGCGPRRVHHLAIEIAPTAWHSPRCSRQTSPLLRASTGAPPSPSPRAFKARTANSSCSMAFAPLHRRAASALRPPSSSFRRPVALPLPSHLRRVPRPAARCPTLSLPCATDL